MLFEKESLSVRDIQQQDKPLLVKWLSNPTVLEFYEGRDNPFNVEKVNENFYIRENDVEKCIVAYKGEAIGYIQFYRVTNETSLLANYGEEIVYGMDQFIGEPDYWNKGLGTLLVKSMVTYLMEEKLAVRIVMDPQITNSRALKCYEKCGFKKVRILPEHELHEGAYRDCWLMEYEKFEV